jgi:BirA family biotin operon repressor/biotin-[acetyl-CoA-carboxylase] ligase
LSLFLLCYKKQCFANTTNVSIHRRAGAHARPQMLPTTVRRKTMGVKTRLIELLDKNRGKYISGAAIAKELNVSRNAVWKAMKSLQENGYIISATPNKGYRLDSAGDLLSAEGIRTYLKDSTIFHVDVRKSVTSTNTVLRELAENNLPEGYVLASETQTAGKGRQGRAFFSPSGHGVYFSVLLRPNLKSEEIAFITPAAAVAVARAVEQILHINLGIKWVNDLFKNEKKVCGILTEASVSLEDGSVDNVILGIGINITEPESGYPEIIKNVAGSLLGTTVVSDNVRCKIIAATLDNFWKFYKNLSELEFLDEYRKRSTIIGHEIFVISQGETTTAHALAIDEKCRLVVRYENGETASLNAGEIITI